jgi:hypothetical protein
VLEKAFRIPSNKIELVPSTFNAHSSQVLNRMGTCHFRENFIKEVRLRYGAIDKCGPREQYFIDQHTSCARKEMEARSVSLDYLRNSTTTRLSRGIVLRQLGHHGFPCFLPTETSRPALAFSEIYSGIRSHY